MGIEFRKIESKKQDPKQLDLCLTMHPLGPDQSPNSENYEQWKCERERRMREAKLCNEIQSVLDNPDNEELLKPYLAKKEWALRKLESALGSVPKEKLGEALRPGNLLDELKAAELIDSKKAQEKQKKSEKSELEQVQQKKETTELFQAKKKKILTEFLTFMQDGMRSGKKLTEIVKALLSPRAGSPESRIILPPQYRQDLEKNWDHLLKLDLGTNQESEKDKKTVDSFMNSPLLGIKRFEQTVEEMYAHDEVARGSITKI